MAEAVAGRVVDWHERARRGHQRPVHLPGVGTLRQAGRTVAQVRRAAHQAAQIEASAELPLERLQMRHQMFRVRHIIERQHGLVEKARHGANKNAGIAHQQLRIDLVDGVFRRMPPPAIARALARRAAAEYRQAGVIGTARRLFAHSHEHRRYPDPPKRLVSRAPHAQTVDLRLALRADGVARHGHQFRRCRCVGENGGALSRRRIRVDVRHATPGQLLPVIVGVPGGYPRTFRESGRTRSTAATRVSNARAGRSDAGNFQHEWHWPTRCPSRRNTRNRDARKTKRTEHRPSPPASVPPPAAVSSASPCPPRHGAPPPRPGPPESGLSTPRRRPSRRSAPPFEAMPPRVSSVGLPQTGEMHIS